MNIDEHHLVPKSRRGREKEPIHRVCHRKIHATFTEKELEQVYNTWESLRDNSVIAAFIKWVSKKEPGYYDVSTDTSAKRGKRR